MTPDPLEKLRIDSNLKRRPRAGLWFTFLFIAGVAGTAVYFALPRAQDSVRSGMKSSRDAATERADSELMNRSTQGTPKTAETPRGQSSSATTSKASTPGSIALKASGYIVARERIEVSPRFMGVVQWIGVRKGDSVTNGQVVVKLDDSEYRARLAEIDGQIGVAKVGVEKAEVDLRRVQELVASKVEMQKVLDDARLALASAKAQVHQLDASRQLVLTWLEWCTIRSPVTGVVLEKLADANELVTPQNFGGGRGPSTSLLAVADLTDLQVEIDVSESDLSKVFPGQTCRVYPQAFAEKQYEGVVAEIAPEASRAKGTLQVKVQIKNPDKHLTPELSARVEFLPAAGK